MVFGASQSNGVIQIFPGPSLIVMRTKLFETKWATTQLLNGQAVNILQCPLSNGVCGLRNYAHVRVNQ